MRAGIQNFFDRVDPYWYCRLIALKTVYITIIVFIANMILHPPLASIIMLIPSVGILIIEMPEINDMRKKDHVYLGYLVVMILTLSLFGSFVYLKEWFILAASLWCFLLYTALRKSPNLFPVVSVFLMLGIITLEGINTGNFYIILNEILFILEFSVIVFWAHKLFPNYYHMVWLSATLRSIEGMISSIDNPQHSDYRPLFNHYQKAVQIMPLLTKKPYSENARDITDKINQYHYFLSGLVRKNSVDEEQIQVIRKDLVSLHEAIKKIEEIRFFQPETQNNTGSLSPHYSLLEETGAVWNRVV